MSTVSMLFGSRSQQGGGTAVPFTPSPVEVLLQEKIVDPSGDQIVVIADSGYDGLSKVTVNAVNARGITLDIIDLNGSTIYPSAFGTTFFSSVKVPVVRLQTPYRLTAQTLMSALSHGGEPTIDPDAGYTGMEYIKINYNDFKWGSPAYKDSSSTYGIGFGVDNFYGYYDETNTYHAFGGRKKLFFVQPPYPLYAMTSTKIAGDAELLGNANANCVLNTVTFTSQDGIHIQGTLEDMSYDAVDIPSLQGYKRYWPGYYNKSWTVTSWNPTDANAHPEDVLEGKSYYANKVGSSTQYYRIGTMKNYAYKETHSSAIGSAYNHMYYENGSIYGNLFYNPYNADDCLEIRSFDNLYLGAVPNNSSDHQIETDLDVVGYVDHSYLSFDGKYKIKYNVNAIVNTYKDTRQFIADDSSGVIGCGIGYMSVSYYYNQTDVYKPLSTPTNFLFVMPPRTAIYNSLKDHILIAGQSFGNARDPEVLWGVTYTSEQGIRRTGNMPDQSELAVDTLISQTTTFYRGYYNRDWNVSPYSLIEGNANIWDVLEGKTMVSNFSGGWGLSTGVVSNYKNVTVRGLTCNYEGQIGTVDYHGLYNMYYNSNGAFLGCLNHDRVYEISSDMGVISIGLPPSQTYYKLNILNTDRRSLYTIGMVDNNSIIQLESAVKIKAKAPTGTATSSRVLSGYTFSNDSGLGYSGTMVNRGSPTISVTPSSQTSIPAGYYTGGTISASGPSLQAIATTTDPSVDSWSSQNTAYMSFTPSSGYDGLSSVKVNVPFLRDGTLLTVSTATSRSTVYNGDTAQSTSGIYLRVAPTKNGYSKTSSYLYVGPSSSMGDATAEDVAYGKTFSSLSGIQVTGTGTVVKRVLKTIWKNPNCVRHTTTTSSSVKHYYIQNSSYSFAAQSITINSYSILIDGSRLGDLLYSEIGYIIIEYQYDDRTMASTEAGKQKIRTKIEIISVAEFFGCSLDRSAYPNEEGYIILSGYDTSYGNEMGRLVYTTSTPGMALSNLYISFTLAYQVRSYDDGNGSPDAAIPLRIWYSQYFPNVDVRDLSDA